MPALLQGKEACPKHSTRLRLWQYSEWDRLPGRIVRLPPRTSARFGSRHLPPGEAERGLVARASWRGRPAAGASRTRRTRSGGRLPFVRERWVQAAPATRRAGARQAQVAPASKRSTRNCREYALIKDSHYKVKRFVAFRLRSSHSYPHHLAAWEQPKLFVEELRAGFRSLR